MVTGGYWGGFLTVTGPSWTFNWPFVFAHSIFYLDLRFNSYFLCSLEPWKNHYKFMCILKDFLYCTYTYIRYYIWIGVYIYIHIWCNLFLILFLFMSMSGGELHWLNHFVPVFPLNRQAVQRKWPQMVGGCVSLRKVGRCSPQDFFRVQESRHHQTSMICGQRRASWEIKKPFSLKPENGPRDPAMPLAIFLLANKW